MDASRSLAPGPAPDDPAIPSPAGRERAFAYPPAARWLARLGFVLAVGWLALYLTPYFAAGLPAVSRMALLPLLFWLFPATFTWHGLMLLRGRIITDDIGIRRETGFRTTALRWDEIEAVADLRPLQGLEITGAGQCIRMSVAIDGYPELFREIMARAGGRAVPLSGELQARSQPIMDVDMCLIFLTIAYSPLLLVLPAGGGLGRIGLAVVIGYLYLGLGTPGRAKSARANDTSLRVEYPRGEVVLAYADIASVELRMTRGGLLTPVAALVLTDRQGRAYELATFPGKCAALYAKIAEHRGR